MKQQIHGDIITWGHFQCYWPFVRGIHQPQRPVTRNVDVFFDLRLNKQLSKQSRRRWFQMTSSSLWRHYIFCNAFDCTTNNLLSSCLLFLLLTGVLQCGRKQSRVGFFSGICITWTKELQHGGNVIRQGWYLYAMIDQIKGRSRIWSQ